jgi:hypothetical protein
VRSRISATAGAIAAGLLVSTASFGFGRGKRDAWHGVVLDKSRAMFDTSNVYFRVTVEFAPGDTKKIRVRRSLWKSLSVGDTLIKEPGARPVKT